MLKAVGTLDEDSLLFLGEMVLFSFARRNGFGTVRGRIDGFGFNKLGREKSGTGLALNLIEAAALPAMPSRAPSILSRTLRNDGEDALSSVERRNGFGTVRGRIDVFGFNKLGREKSGTVLALNLIEAAALPAMPSRAPSILSRTLSNDGEDALSSVARWNGFGTVRGRIDVFGCNKLGREKSGTGLALNSVGTAALPAMPSRAPSILSRTLSNDGEDALSSVARWNGFGTVRGRIDVFGCNKLG